MIKMNHSMKWGSQRIESEWVIEGVYKRGTINLIAGDPGIGKSFLTLELAARVSHEGEQVLLLSAEDDPDDTIAPRCIAHDADTRNIRLFEGFLDAEGYTEPFHLGTDMDRFQRFVTCLRNVSLIIIDPISAYMSPAAARSDTVARAEVMRLKRLALETNCAILCVTHLEKRRKNDAGTMIRTLDTDVLPALSSTVQIVQEHTRHNQRVVSMVKNDVGDIKLPRVFEIFGGMVNWFETLDDPKRNNFENGNYGFYNRMTKGDEACAFLLRTLSGQPRPAAEIQAQARGQGFSKNTIERAKKTMGIRSFKKHNVWYWNLGLKRREEHQGSKRASG